MMKRLIFCFDGTWNEIDSRNPTNVSRISQSVSRFDRQGQFQEIYYDEGVGTSATDHWTGGILGHGLFDKIVRAYHFLVLNYEPGDELYVFGFSRGAFSARSFVGLLRNCGVMSRRSLPHIRDAVNLYLRRDFGASPNSESSREFRFRHCPRLCLPGDREWRREAHADRVEEDQIELRVEFLGIWDSVGALGVPKHLKPLAWLNRKYRFHDTKLSSFVKRARHAVAADEKRRTFEPGMWSNLDDLNSSDPSDERYEQLIFPGVHSAVGGGGPIRGLSDAAFEWVFEGARNEGLAFDTDEQSPIYNLKPDHRAQLFNQTGKDAWSLKDWVTGMGIQARKFPPMDRKAFHPTLVRRFGTAAAQLAEKKEYRPDSIKMHWNILAEMVQASAFDIQSDSNQLAEAGDDRALRAPARVENYQIQPGDTLESIAEEKMGESEGGEILSLHNRNVGLLFDDEKLYAGAMLEIPLYDGRAK